MVDCNMFERINFEGKDKRCSKMLLVIHVEECLLRITISFYVPDMCVAVLEGFFFFFN